MRHAQRIPMHPTHVAPMAGIRAVAFVLLAAAGALAEQPTNDAKELIGWLGETYSGGASSSHAQRGMKVNPASGRAAAATGPSRCRLQPRSDEQLAEHDSSALRPDVWFARQGGATSNRA